MPTGGVGCPPLLCLGRLFTHDGDEYGDHDDEAMMLVSYLQWLI